MSRVLHCVTLFLFVLGFSALSIAQTGTSISGTVTDPQGMVVPKATVTITSKTSGAVRTVASDAQGNYTFTLVNPDTYQIAAEAAGFKKVLIQEVVAQVNVAARVDIKFAEVGALTETVVVSAQATAINTVDASIGTAFTSTQVRELPLNARNVVGLLSLQPGVTRFGEVNGSRADQANVTLDGVDVNDQDQRGNDERSGNVFFSVLRLTPDALQEFRVTTTNANADQGRSSGAQVALITRSGSNQFHGSLYEFHRNTKTTANEWFNNKAKVARPKLLRNNFGAAVGGPIVKDKAFFFANYEGFRQASDSTVVQRVPTAALGQGIVRYFTASGASDAGCPAGTPSGVRCITGAQRTAAYTGVSGVDPGTNPAALALLSSAASRYAGNDTTIGDGLNSTGYRFNASTPVRNNTLIGKFDFNLTSKQTAFVRLNYQNDSSVSSPAFPDTPAPSVWVHPRGLAVNHNYAATPTLVNSLRYGFTRDAITSGGDSNANFFSFRFIYQPYNFTRSVVRKTPVHNIVDDLSWLKGRHTMQMGANLRMISNDRASFLNAYDTLTTNPSYFASSGNSIFVTSSGQDIFPDLASRSRTGFRDGLAAVIGRLSQYSANLTYARDGKLGSVGTPSARVFNTQEYEFYFQDTWRLKPNLTINAGLRYSTSTPVYEANGFQLRPTPGLSEIFNRRVAGMEAGKPYNDVIQLNFGGKANNKPGFYSQDWNNFAPSLSAAWSPSFKSGLLGALFGDKKSTIRGGYRITYDRIGSALAVAFDLNNQLGFNSSSAISANTYNMSDRLAPLFTGLNQDVRSLPRMSIQQSLTFPQARPADGQRRIESSLDDGLTTPYNHSWSFGIGRELGKDYSLEVAYVGRIARNLLITRDVLTPNNMRDPKSGMDWYTAIRQLIDLRDGAAAINDVKPIAFFENFFPKAAGARTVRVPGQPAVTMNLTATQRMYQYMARSAVGGSNNTDYTTMQDDFDSGFGTDGLFYQPQYGALAAFSTLGTSDYHSLQVVFRKAMSRDFSFDFNYTAAHSLDTASGRQSGTSFASPFVTNPFNLNVNRANSDFDLRHQVNANFIYEIPVGKGKRLLADAPGLVNQILGGWQVTGIYRFHTGLPAPSAYDANQWATNWNAQSWGVPIRKIVSTPTRTGDPNLFSDPVVAYKSYRNAYPGEQGVRNDLRYPKYQVLDTGLYKSFPLPKEGWVVKFRWEVFNLTNTQYFTSLPSLNRRLSQDPWASGGPDADFGKFSGIQGSPRIMQFALRFEF